MSDSKSCAFHTGSEIVCLTLEPHDHDVFCDEHCARSKLLPKILDIEVVLIESLEKDFLQKDVLENLRLTEYELLVTSIDASPLSVQAYINAILYDDKRAEVVADFSVEWNVDKGSYDVEHCPADDDVEKENVATGRPVAPSPKAIEILKELIAGQKSSGIHCLDNMQFVECQLSLNSLDSPTDTISISLATHDCNLVHRSD